MSQQVSCCDNCHKPGRLHWCLPGDRGNEAGIKPLLASEAHGPHRPSERKNPRRRYPSERLPPG